MRGQAVLDASRLLPVEAVDFPQSHRPGRTVQEEDSLASCPDHMDMGGSVIIRLDHNPKPVETQDNRHGTSLAETQALG